MRFSPPQQPTCERISENIRLARAAKKLSQAGSPCKHWEFYVENLDQIRLGVVERDLKGIYPKEHQTKALGYLRQRVRRIFLQGSSLGGIARFLSGEGASLTYVAPKEWRATLSSLKVPVDESSSSKKWFVKQKEEYKAGILSVLKKIAFACLGVGPKANGKSYALFVDVGARAFTPNPPPEFKTKNLFSVLKEKPFFDCEIEEIWAIPKNVSSTDQISDPVKLVRSFFPRLPNIKARCLFVLQALKILGIVTVRWLSGHWWAPFFLRDAVDLAYVRHLPKHLRARDYIFHSTIKTVRPVWTYEVEKTGSDITCLLLSTHVGTIIPGQPQYPLVDLEYIGLNWSRYIVWNEKHTELLRRYGVQIERATAVGSIGISDRGRPIPKADKPIVAIFEVNPIHPAASWQEAIPRPYYTLPITLAFLEQAMDAVVQSGGIPFWKPKGRGHHHFHLFEAVQKKYSAVLLEDGISPYRLIDVASASISMPFTTPGWIAADVNKPAAYFDPTETLAGFDRYPPGCDLVLGKTALIKWLTAQLNS